MGSSTKIEWTDATLNAVVGCASVSEGCKNCYAARLAATRLKHTGKYRGLAVMRSSGPQWTRTVRIDRAALEQVIRWREPKRIFFTAMGDPFFEELKDKEVAALFGAMALAPHHTFQVLTKRPERAAALLPKLNVGACLDALMDLYPDFRGPTAQDSAASSRAMRQIGRDPNTYLTEHTWPMPHIVLGTSAETPGTFRTRVPELIAAPAAHRFLSLEPWLSPFAPDFDPWLRAVSVCNFGDCLERTDGTPPVCPRCRRAPLTTVWGEDSLKLVGKIGKAAHQTSPPIGWVIVGGESGPNARPCSLTALHEIVKACQTNGIRAFVKQLGSRPSGWATEDAKGADPEEWPWYLRVREVPEVP